MSRILAIALVALAVEVKRANVQHFRIGNLRRRNDPRSFLEYKLNADVLERYASVEFITLDS
jgi:hypothetical protein